MDRKEEKKLIVSAQKGSSDAFEQLYNEYKLELFKSAVLMMKSSADAEDAVAETFIKAFRNLGRFDTRYPLRPWLHQILSNECANIYKKNRSDVVQLDDFSTDWKENVADKNTPDAQTRVIEDEDSVAIRAMIEKLSEEHRQVVILHYFQNFDITNISQMLGVPVGTVKSRLFHARKQLARFSGEAT